MQLAFKTILFPTDFSDASELPFEYACSLAIRFAAKLQVLHVLEEPFPIGSEVYGAELPAFRERRQRDAEERLRDMTSRMVGLDVATSVAIGTPARQIVQAAEQFSSDLIVMGTHGRGAFAHLVMGSVAERVVRTAPCPVLTVRSPSVPAIVQHTERAAARV